VLVRIRSLGVGPEGLEPSPTWLRARHAAANTLIPSFRYAAAASLLHRILDIRWRLPLVAFVAKIGVGRTRTLTLQIKSLLCCLYTTTPGEDVRAFESRQLSPHHNQLPCNVFQKAKNNRLGWS
jgi:hypothetical protein